MAWSQRDAWVHPRRCRGPAQEKLRTGLFIIVILIVMLSILCIVAWKFSNERNTGWTKPRSNCLGSWLPERSDDHHRGKTFPTKNLGLDTTFFWVWTPDFFWILTSYFPGDYGSSLQLGCKAQEGPESRGCELKIFSETEFEMIFADLLHNNQLVRLKMSVTQAIAYQQWQADVFIFSKDWWMS